MPSFFVYDKTILKLFDNSLVITMITSQGNVYERVEKTLKYKDRDYDEKWDLVNILLNLKGCGIKILGTANGKEYNARLFMKDISLSRLVYMLEKWKEQQKRGGITKYFLWEERSDQSLPEKITYVH